jgi:hypothetical protein
MPKNIIIALMYHRHKFSDVVFVSDATVHDYSMCCSLQYSVNTSSSGNMKYFLLAQNFYTKCTKLTHNRDRLYVLSSKLLERFQLNLVLGGIWTASVV